MHIRVSCAEGKEFAIQQLKFQVQILCIFSMIYIFRLGICSRFSLSYGNDLHQNSSSATIWPIVPAPDVR
jgi:hypothetical protein